MNIKRLLTIAKHLCSAEKLTTYQVISDNIAIITINRPQKLNSFNKEMWDQLNYFFQQAESDQNIKVIILTGVGKSFASGGDLTLMKEWEVSSIIINNPIEKWFSQLSLMKKPVIAAVNGYAFGGGCEIAMMCDIIIASKTAKFALPETKLGLIPGAGGTERLVRAIGKYRAMEIVLVGGVFSAEEGKTIGLVNSVVENVIDEAIIIAKRISRSQIQAICIAKRAINFAFETGLSGGLVYEQSLFNSSVLMSDKEK